MSGWVNTDPAAADCVVATQGLSKRFGRDTALDRVDLRITGGAVYVLVGANGAGKSTTLKVLMNLERADEGTAQVFGLDVAGHGPEVRAQVGYVPEHAIVPYPWMSCRRLLRHVAVYYPTWDAGYADRLTRSLGIPLERRAGALSKGEVRRLQLVMALAHRPPLLVLDEPMDGLDPVVRNQILTMVTEHIADTPTTALISTHQLHEIESLVDDIGVLREGRLIAQMPRDMMRRTVRRYRVEVPDGWEAPSRVQVATLRRSSTGREIQCTLAGEEREIIQRLELTGARVRDVSALPLEDAAVALLRGAES